MHTVNSFVLDNENRVVLRSLQQQVNVKSNRRTMDIIRELTEMATLDPDYINASFIEVIDRSNWCCCLLIYVSFVYLSYNIFILKISQNLLKRLMRLFDLYLIEGKSERFCL